ncbi:hypothetical protein ASF88_18430 [Leifsonia sp. Leaf336]|nr:hypothetical protein ASF88_18430 [Leifsonia sp. Leaf336]
MRFRATTANRRGIQPGVFALVNGLASAGRLSAAEERFRRSSNDWFTAHLIDPSTVDPGLFRDHPLAVSWFAEAASDLLERIPGYLRILERHLIDWERVSTLRPGRIIYSDAHQVLAVTAARAGDTAASSLT